MQGKFFGENIPTWSQQSWATPALPELTITYQRMQHPKLYRQIFIFTSQIVVKREILVLKPSQYDSCHGFGTANGIHWQKNPS